MDLRPYQMKARDCILAELERVRATLLVLATGLGKTVCFAAVAAAYVSRGQRVLVVAHRSELLDQAAATLERFGLSVAVEQADRHAGDADVVVASVQTMRGVRLGSFPVDAFGLVVVDEAHHTAAKTYRALLKHFEAARVLGVTATPDRTDGVGLRASFESVAYRMELGEGIRAGWLARIELRSVVVESLDLSDVHVVAGELHAGELEQELVRDRVLHEVAAPLAELSEGRQTLAFVVGVQQAHALAEVLRSYGVRAAAVAGGMSREARAEVLADYRAGRIQVVCNAMLLTEGFDCPETSCVALVRPTRSRALITQMIGRGTRPAEGKAACLVLDFVPERAGRIRLAAPADALAGKELSAGLAARVRALSRTKAGELEALIQQAQADEQAEAAAEVQRRIGREFSVAYVAHRMPIEQLLAEVATRDARARPATETQIEALRRAGFDVPTDLTADEAQGLFDVLRERRARGLCTVKQAKLLRRYGLRDDVSFELAGEALSAVAANGWRPPMWLYRDPRFAKGEGVAA